MRFKFPIFLKFHNNGNQNKTTPLEQYLFWTTVFKESDVTIICEDGTINSSFCNHKIIQKFLGYQSSDWQLDVSQQVLGFWKNHYFANVTPTVMTNSNYFWIIDADDMRFLIDNNYQLEKLIISLQKVEKIVVEENLDFANFDVRYTSNYMRFINTPDIVGWGHPCLGISLMKNENFYDVKNLSIKKEFLGINHDMILHVIHHQRKKSKVFCIKDVRFHHYNWGNVIQDDLYFSDNGLTGLFYDGVESYKVVDLPIKSEIIL